VGGVAPPIVSRVQGYQALAWLFVFSGGTDWCCIY